MSHSISTKLSDFRDKFHRAWIRKSELEQLMATIDQLRSKKSNLKSTVKDLDAKLEAASAEIAAKDYELENTKSAIIKLIDDNNKLIAVLDEAEALLDELDGELTSNL